MKSHIHLLISLTLIFDLLFFNLPNVKACGLSYLVPVFEYQNAPENPYENFANGKLGIIKPTYPRSVLFAAYRYINGGGFNADEQKALVEIWDANFNNKNYSDNKISESVKKWIETRKRVIKKEKKTPQIYLERPYGGYDFFPNCTKNAFEVAIETLEKRITDYGSDNEDVKNWVLAQDMVFKNCASGKRIPGEPNATMPEWLQKDRKYQIAAAEFYSLNFSKAKTYFEEISNDSDSTWQEVSKYLVGRTLIRQASLSNKKELNSTIYAEAEQQLQSVSSEGGKYANAANKLIGLIKYRTRPKERVKELSQNLAYFGGENFRQELIDYTWLLDKFEKNALINEQKRIDALKPKEENDSDNLAIEKMKQEATDATKVTSDEMKNADLSESNGDRDSLTLKFFNDNYSKSWIIRVPVDATDEDAFTEAEKVMGQLTDKMKKRISEARFSAYLSRYDRLKSNSHEGAYTGDLETSMNILPDFLRFDELSSWLFAFQIQSDDAYRLSFEKFQQTNSDLWLVATISKANINSPNLSEIIDASKKISTQSPAYPTVAYHLSKILLAQGKTQEAKKIIDKMLNTSDDLPISTVNKFTELRMGLAETLDEFLKFSLKSPFTFSQDGYSTSIEEIITERKSYYDPKYDKKTRAEHEQEIESEFRGILSIRDQKMLDHKAVDIINQNFPTSLLLRVQKSKEFPEYLRKRLAKAIWTRAVLINDFETADKILGEFVDESHKSYQLFEQYIKTANGTEKQRLSLFIILKNKDLTPFLTGGIGPPNDSYSGATKWWCSLSEEEWDSTQNRMVKRKITKPDFVTETQQKTAQEELNKLNKLNDAPAFLTEKVLEWANKSPRDKRIEESLYLIFEANDWDKYGCGGSFEKRKAIANILKRKYPRSVWTQKVIEEQN